MSEDRDGCELTRRAAAEIARLAPAELPAERSRELIRRAVLAERAGSAPRWGLPLLVAATAGALALAIAMTLAPPPAWQHVETHPWARPSGAAVLQPSRLSLPSGDQLIAAEGAAFDVRSAAPQRREVALQRGQMLFDVARLGQGQRFDVVTPDARVSVLGTVFTVEAVDGRTVVRVYEGHVEVAHGAQRIRLRVGEHFVSDGRRVPIDPLRREALAAAGRRHRAPPVAPVAPVVIELAAQPAAPPSAASIPTPPAQSRPPLPVTVAAARGELQQGRVQRVLTATAAAIDGRRPPLGQWYLVHADALLRDRKPRPAAAALESAAAYLHGEPSRDAAHRAALAYAEQLGDPARALHVLKASGVLGPDKFVHARGMELWVRLLVSLERRWEASAVARRYLRTYPHSPEAPAMRSIAEYRVAQLGQPLL